MDDDATSSLVQKWLRQMLIESLSGPFLDGPWIRIASRALEAIDEQEFELIGADTFEEIRGQVHWVSEPGAKRRLIEALVRLPWESPSPFRGDQTLVEEYCRSLAESVWVPEQVGEIVVLLASDVSSPVVVAQYLLEHLDESAALALLSRIEIGVWLRQDLTRFGPIGDTLLRNARIRKRVEVLSHFLAVIHPAWTDTIAVNGMLRCCRDRDSALLYLQEMVIGSDVEVNCGVLTRGESLLLHEFFSEAVRAEPYGDELEKLWREVLSRFIGNQDIITWLHEIPGGDEAG